MRKLFFGVYHPSIILTYFGVFSSFTGLAFLMSKGLESMPFVMILFIFSACFDMFDGVVARRCKRTEKEKEFGVQLDSLADIISFVVFPAFIMLKLAGVHMTALLIAFFYAFAGIMRLGWFNITTDENPGMFQGLPVIYTALIYPILYLILSYLKVPELGIWFEMASVILSLLFIANFKMKKPSLKVLLGFAGLAVFIIILLLLL